MNNRALQPSAELDETSTAGGPPAAAGESPRAAQIPCAASTAQLSAECLRVELLAHCALALRQGQPLEGLIERLRAAQAAVLEGRRQGGPWLLPRLSGLGELERDVLACVVSAELDPRVGWLFQQLQQLGQPHPSAALVQELLSIPAGEVAPLWAALADDAPLVQRGLIDRAEGWPHAPLRPGLGVTAALLDVPSVMPTPPGALRVTQSATWADLILSADCLSRLHEFLLWLRYRDQVVTSWGGRRTGGPVALFSGASGTGKTLAATVLAGELGWPLYLVDLGSLVSKYVGETEKNLNRLFAATHGQNAVLLFDEADSLFGRRGEVKEARDRWANMEVSHLLSRIEQHDGPCVLTTNLRQNIDPAFVRRFQAVVDFARPDAAARARLWALHLPPRAPRDHEVDPVLIGSAVNLTGGEIRNAALHAAYLAAGGRGQIGLGEVALGIWRELSKEGNPPSMAVLGPLRRHLEEALQRPCSRSTNWR